MNISLYNTSNKIPNPDKHVVRGYMDRRSHERTPPPTPEEIRRQLGWGVVDDKRIRDNRDR